MITKVVKDQEGRSNYDELFRAAEVQLSLPEGSIKTIHDYLNAITDINVRQDTNNYNLLRLPVAEDEPLFEIDANTREITVPDVFKKNGLTVQGDKLAEIVYFKMARFFDMMDLYLFANDGVTSTNIHNGAHTYIEWYNPSAKNPDYQKGVDFAYAMTCDDDYIYFGWPLADKVSGEVGNIQFSVRFLNIEENKIVYNYATKIASCEVKTTLNFDLTDGSITSDSWEDILYSRPVYSSVINSTESPAAILLQGIETGVYDMTPVYESHEVPNPDYNSEDPESQATITVQDSEPSGWLLDIPVVATTSKAVREGTVQTLTFKWYHNSALVTENAKWTDSDAPASYEDESAKQSVFHADEIGTYTVWIGNKISDKKNVRYIYTGTVTIPGPKDVKMDGSQLVLKGYTSQDNPTRLIAGVQNAAEYDADKLLYTWYREGGTVVQAASSNPVYEATDEGKYYCIVRNSRNGVITDITNAATSDTADIRVMPKRLTSLVLSYVAENATLTAVATHQYAGHKIEYNWYHYVDNNYVPVFTELTGTQSSYAPTAPGIYVVEAREVVFDEESAPLYQRANDGMRSQSNNIELELDGTTLKPVED